jgi:hypothetical protein
MKSPPIRVSRRLARVKRTGMPGDAEVVASSVEDNRWRSG